MLLKYSFTYAPVAATGALSFEIIKPAIWGGAFADLFNIT